MVAGQTEKTFFLNSRPGSRPRPSFPPPPPLMPARQAARRAVLTGQRQPTHQQLIQSPKFPTQDSQNAPAASAYRTAGAQQRGGRRGADAGEGLDKQGQAGSARRAQLPRPYSTRVPPQRPPTSNPQSPTRLATSSRPVQQGRRDDRDGKKKNSHVPRFLW
jgi:hypothetical protein